MITVESVYSGHGIKRTSVLGGHDLLERKDLQSNFHREISIKRTGHKTDSTKAETFFLHQMKISPKKFRRKADIM